MCEHHAQTEQAGFKGRAENQSAHKSSNPLVLLPVNSTTSGILVALLDGEKGNGVDSAPCTLSGESV
jgi:hypothetical protein